MRQSLRLSRTAVVVALLWSAAAPAFADKTVEEITIEGRIPRRAPGPVTYVVGHQDIDLTSAKGAETLNRRIWTTADYVCEQANAGLDVYLCATKAALGVKAQVEEAKRSQPQPFEPGPTWTPPPGKE
jgi:UrcA family protein